MANVTFLDQFDRADASLAANNGWITIAAGATFGIEILDKVATNEGSKRSFALQLLSVPSISSQEIEAHVWIGAEAADARVFIGTNADGTSTASLFCGFGVSLLAASSGVRTLEIWQDAFPAAPGVTSPTVQASRDVASLTIKTGGSDVGVIQRLRFIINAETQGTRIRAYLNNDDDDAPTLEYISKRDRVTDPSGGYFKWLFGFGSTTARTLAVMAFSAKDSDFRKADVIRKDTMTLAEVIAAAKLRYEGSSSQTDFDADLCKQLANDAQEEILNELGDKATFLQPRELMSLVVSSADGTFLLPTYVETPLTIIDSLTGHEWDWKRIGQDTNGQIICAMDPSHSSGPFWVTFETRKERMDADTDASRIPRRFAEVLILGVVYRLSSFDKSRGRQASYEKDKLEFREKLMQMKAKLATFQRATKPRLRTALPTRAIAIPYYGEFWTRGG